MIGSLVNMGSSGKFPFIACQEMVFRHSIMTLQVKV